MQIWIFEMRRIIVIIIGFLTASCTFFSESDGQVIYHWERQNTGIQKFSRDHSECMRKAEDFKLLPDVRSWFYSEEAKLDIRADWHAEKGIWASYVAYPGAQPVMVNSLREDEDISPREYRICMEERGYWHRELDIPTHTNLYTYKPQAVYQDIPFNIGYQ